jgi:two-component system, NarL family, sensor histidine kinase DesK
MIGTGGGHEETALRRAWLFAPAFLCLVLPVRLAHTEFWTGPAGAAVALALYALPLSYTVPRTRTTWARHRGPLLAIQAAMTYLPVFVFGVDWAVGASGLLGGLVLLTVRTPVSWVLLGGLVAAEMARIITLGVDRPHPATATLVVSSVVVLVNTALTLFGLVRLADLVNELHSTTDELAVQAVRDRQLRTAARMRSGIGDRLGRVIAHARDGLVALSSDPELARRTVREAALVAREALAQVRAAASTDPDVDRSAQRSPSGDAVAARLAKLVLIAVTCAFLVQFVTNVLVSPSTSPATIAVAMVAVALVLGLQMYHSLARREGSGPPGWRWTWAVQTMVGLGSFALVDELSLIGLAGFAAGSGLLPLGHGAGWATFAAIPVTVGVVMAIRSPFGASDVVYTTAATAATGLMIYGLSRLTDLARRVEIARRKLVHTAVQHEQLRVVRDTHDMLGLSLSAVALKCDLAVRLIGRDDAQARAEIERLIELAGRSQGEVQSVAYDTAGALSMTTELATARDALASAGIDLHVSEPAQPLSRTVDTALATVLREAVTNVLRHAAPTQCIVQVTAQEGSIWLRVANDGASVGEADRHHRAGAAIDNLQARVQDLGGTVTAQGAGEDWFELAVEIPICTTR